MSAYWRQWMLDELIVTKNKTLTIVLAVTET